MSFSGAYQFQSLSRGEIVEANGGRQGGRGGRKEKDSNQNKPAPSQHNINNLSLKRPAGAKRL